MELLPESCDSIHLQVGKEQRVACVFSCPGRHEEAAGHPAAKGTGRNLELLLSLLGKALQRNDLARTNITITNAWPAVEYSGRTGRSEATAKEISAPENVQRLQRELEEITDFVIFCGRKAQEVAPLLKLKHKPKLVFIEHLGLRGLSLINTDVAGNPIIAAEFQALGSDRVKRKREIQGENTGKRLEVLVQQILRQLEG